MLLHESIRDGARRAAATPRSMEALDQKTMSDRRSKVRFPLELPVHFNSIAKKHPVNGTGRTVNISSNGLLIASAGAMNPGAWLEISVQWPSRLDGGIHLQLAAVGKVVRCVESDFAVEFHSYEFRTMRRTLQRAAPLEVITTA